MAAQWLWLGAARANDESLRPVGGLDLLRWLGVPNAFDMAQFDWHSNRLPHTLCGWLAPYYRAHRSLLPNRTCKANWCVITSGKGSKLLCPNCNAPRLAEAALAFQDAVHAACVAGPG